MTDYEKKLHKVIESAFKAGRSKESWKGFKTYNPEIEALEEAINEFCIGFMEYAFLPEVQEDSERDPSEVLKAYKKTVAVKP